MAFTYADRQLLVTLHEHQHNIERMLIIMAKGMDALVEAINGNSTATDALSDEVAVVIDWIKNHEHAEDPALQAMADRLAAKNAQALKAKDDLAAAVDSVSASGGPATP